MIYLQCSRCGDSYTSDHVCQTQFRAAPTNAFALGYAAGQKDAEAELAEAQAVLKEVEWAVHDLPGIHSCPACGRSKEDGHAPDCRLKKVLG